MSIRRLPSAAIALVALLAGCTGPQTAVAPAPLKPAVTQLPADAQAAAARAAQIAADAPPALIAGDPKVKEPTATLNAAAPMRGPRHCSPAPGRRWGRRRRCAGRR